ncbi:MAG: hypothetical protein RL329_509 [Bacteroidota bacterium]|jgi:hypothetical protein
MMIYQLYVSTNPDRFTIRVKNPADDGMYPNLIAESKDLSLFKIFIFTSSIGSPTTDVEELKDRFQHFESKLYRPSKQILDSVSVLSSF